jgi:ribosomal protein S12 methylthiotransferase accessory factor
MEMEITFGGGKKVAASYRGFVHKADQRVESGGEGTAPEPVDFFFVAIGTCTAYTMLAFCRSRGLPSEGMRVSVRLDRDESTHKVVKMRHEVHLPAGFPEKYVAPLLRAAATCTVKRYLENPPEIETVVAGAP